MELSFKGKQVFITGGSRGIGKAIKEMYEENGAEVIAPAREELDLSDMDSIREYLKVHSSLQPDIFIHCAGFNELAGIEEINDDILSRVFNINLFSAIELLKYLSKGMKKRNEGKIIFISSVYSVVSRERRIAYSASKNALTGLTKTLGLELAPYNIMVNAVAPGYVMTDMTRRNLSAADIQTIKENMPTGKLQTEEEIGNAVLFLTSAMNSSITGQLLVVDGGFTCK